MAVMLDGDRILLSATCGVEEAETLFALIQGNPDAVVDITQAGAVHTALWQVLLALAPPVIGDVRDPFVRRWISSQLMQSTRPA